jgi:hypothetical protein
MKRFSELKIILSNCLVNGSPVDEQDTESLFTVIRGIVNETDGVEFQGMNMNQVSGEHNSSTFILVGTFYNLSSNPDQSQMLDMEYLISRIVQDIPNFVCSEIRIEHTRHRTSFDTLSHPQLARTV